MAKSFVQNLESLLPQSTQKIAVAVSGGADSFALLHMTHLWTVKNKTKLLALTVDHGLRKESADEAKNIAAWCKKNNIAHQTLKWSGPKPKSDIQNKAREARRALLFTTCKKEKITTILMGHHADDQAETILMRLQRGTGLHGLLGIQPVTHDDTIIIIRPLLSARRKELRAYCVKNKLPFTDDPSNENDAFERVRVRKTLKRLPDLAVGLEKTAERLTRAEHALNDVATAWCTTHVQKNWLPMAQFQQLPDELQLRVLTRFIAHAPLDGLERLQHAINAPGFKGQTLGNIWLRPKVLNRQKGLIFTAAPPRNWARFILS